jgi:hypothetical protein
VGPLTGGMNEIGPPEKLSGAHDLSGFDCGEPVLNDWLRHRALQNEASGASRTYVVCSGKRIMGYYTLAVGAVTHAEVPERIKRNMPVMVLGRLAVGQSVQVQHIGGGLLRDAVMRTMQAAEIAGIRAILVHAISAQAKRFYEAYGFIASPVDPLTVMIAVAEVVRTMGNDA